MTGDLFVLLTFINLYYDEWAVEKCWDKCEGFVLFCLDHCEVGLHSLICLCFFQHFIICKTCHFRETMLFYGHL